MNKKKINIIIAAADAVLALALGTALVYASAKIDEVSLQGAADSWAADSALPYSVSSLYTSKNAAYSIGEVYQLRAQILDKAEEQLTDTEDGYYADCWYGVGNMSLTGSKSSADVKACYVGGDYFDIHNAEVISGSVFKGDNANIDTIVLDENASWKLFGALDTEGMTVTANNMTFYVSAVIRAPSDKEKVLKKAYEDDGQEPMVYIPYEAADVIYGEEQRFTAYDIMLPNNYDGFASDELRSAAGCSEGDTAELAVTDSSLRFGIKEIREKADNIGSMMDSGNNIVFPFWEDAARTVMLELCILYKAFLIPFILLMISVCYWLFRLVGLIAYIIRRIYRFFDDKAEKKKLENYYKTHPMIIIKPENEGESK
ncbi:MAG: ABC transporter permease [Oscillospiraceae bacterium]|nr:ABC transporter permease [Oscillospiraceae bacterium]